MEGSKEYFLRMRENDFGNLTPEIRSKFTYTEVVETNEYESHKNDPTYLRLYKAKKKANRDLQNYLYDKRNK